MAGTAAAPYATPIPGVAQYGQAALAANTAYQNALTRLNESRSAAARAAGYQADIDPTTGTMRNLRVDTNNPFGGLQSMLGAQSREDADAEYAAQERGIHGGLANQASTDLRFAHGAQSADFGQKLLGTFADLQTQQDDALNQKNNALYQAELAAAQLAIENQQFDPANFDGLTYPAYGSGADNPPTDASGGDNTNTPTGTVITPGVGNNAPAGSTPSASTWVALNQDQHGWISDAEARASAKNDPDWYRRAIVTPGSQVYGYPDYTHPGASKAPSKPSTSAKRPGQSPKQKVIHQQVARKSGGRKAG